ncbi:MAG: prephenate dehydratase [Candidatus Gastranaerophilales bacterium]|nr:prephenate dehydratase [Candidatus Gastranaerophilales bacterium]
MEKLKVEKIYYLGPEGTYTHKALTFFEKEFNLEANDYTPLKTIKKVLEAVNDNGDVLGVIPIENSIEGIVRESIDNLIKQSDERVTIMGEVILPISHALMSKAINKNKIKTIISHPQALAQCANYIEKELDDVQILEETSTSAAAKRVSLLDNTYAAIANEMAADVFNLSILDTAINDEKDNKTRFLLIGKYEMPQTGNDKTSIVFSTKNVAGALAKILDVFNKYNLNLSYIDSRPSKKNLGEYNFFIDFDGHIEDKDVDNAMDEIAPLVSYFRFNGSYKKAVQ